MRKWFDSSALWLSMLIGAFGYKYFLPLAPILPWLIFFMLFFTFCKVNPLDLRLHRWHWAVLILQISFSLAAYAGVYLWTGNRIVAQGLMLCFIMPTATAAPVIAGKLGGSIQNLTAFTLLSNLATTMVVPALFPIVYPAAEKAFWPAFMLILGHISPLLLGPFLAAWALRAGYNYYYRRKSLTARKASGLAAERSYSDNGLTGEAGHKEFVMPTSLAQIPFYLWVASIIVLTSVVTETTISNVKYQISNILTLLILSFFACLLQFGLGKLIGYKLPAPSKGRDYQDVLVNPAAAPATMAGVSSITAGQAFGQKNTSLGVWMAQTFLDPLSSLGAAAYIIWQNLFNSLQLFLAVNAQVPRSRKKGVAP